MDLESVDRVDDVQWVGGADFARVSGGRTRLDPSSRSSTPNIGSVTSDVSRPSRAAKVRVCSTIASRLPWVISTAFAGPVDPVVKAIINSSSPPAMRGDPVDVDGVRPNIASVCPPTASGDRP
ncbi:hypothetical protein GCM10020255_028250 [Rhodococcus baikonurensis]